METMVTEEVGQTGPLQLRYSELNSVNHDALISDKRTGADPELPQERGQRLEQEMTSTTTVDPQSLFEDVSMDGETVAIIEGDSPPVCSHVSSLLVFEDISMDGNDSHAQLVGQNSNLTPNCENVFKPLFSSSAALCSESPKVGSDSSAPTLSVNGTCSLPTKTESCHDLNLSGKVFGATEEGCNTSEHMTQLNTVTGEVIELEKTQHSVQNGVKQGIPIMVQEADAPKSSFYRRKRNHPTSILNEDTIMEHSGLEELLEKRARVCMMEDALQCLKPEEEVDGSSPPERVARELARCLHEPKYKLLLDVVRVLGAEKAMELFEKTAQIQEDGGVLTSQGDKKRAPGGVFLTLVKNSVTPEQRKEIFRIDKEIRARKAKEEKRRKANERWRKERQREIALMKQKAEWELQKFRTQLGEDFEDGQISEVESTRLPRKDLNMHKRFPGLVNRKKESTSSDIAGSGTDSLALCLEQKSGSLSQTTGKLGGGSTKDKGEVMEVSRDHTNKEPQVQDKSRRDKNEALAEEKLAAEEFEQMNERDLDFGIYLA